MINNIITIFGVLSAYLFGIIIGVTIERGFR